MPFEYNNSQNVNKKRAVFVTIIVRKTSEDKLLVLMKVVSSSTPYRVIDEVVPEAMSFDMIKW